MEAFPIAPLLMGGCEDPSLVREVLDSCFWLKSIPAYPFARYTDAVITSILEDGYGGLQAAFVSRHRLPVDAELSVFKNVASSGHPGLSKKINCLTEARENPIVSALLCEMSTSFDLALSLNPSLERLITTWDKGEPLVTPIFLHNTHFPS